MTIDNQNTNFPVTLTFDLGRSMNFCSHPAITNDLHPHERSKSGEYFCYLHLQIVTYPPLDVVHKIIPNLGLLGMSDRKIMCEAFQATIRKKRTKRKLIDSSGERPENSLCNMVFCRRVDGEDEVLAWLSRGSPRINGYTIKHDDESGV